MIFPPGGAAGAAVCRIHLRLRLFVTPGAGREVTITRGETRGRHYQAQASTWQKFTWHKVAVDAVSAFFVSAGDNYQHDKLRPESRIGKLAADRNTSAEYRDRARQLHSTDIELGLGPWL